MNRVLTVVLVTFTFIFSLTTSAQVSKKRGIKTVVIDAGHGGPDAGCSGSSVKEKDVALAIALKLGNYIEKNYTDVKVIYTRKTDVFVEVHERANIANKAKADLFICVHCNSAGKDKTAFGTETFVMGINETKENLNVAKRENSAILLEDNYEENYDGFDPDSPEANIVFSLHQNAFLDQSINLASKVQNEFREVGRSSRGVKQARLWVIYKTAMPSVLIETGFLTNPTEEKYLSSEQGQDYLASGIFRAFKNYKSEVEGLNTSKKEPVIANTSQPTVSQPQKQPAKSNQTPVVTSTAPVVNVPAISKPSNVAAKPKEVVQTQQPISKPTVTPVSAPVNQKKAQDIAEKKEIKKAPVANTPKQTSPKASISASISKSQTANIAATIDTAAKHKKDVESVAELIQRQREEKPMRDSLAKVKAKQEADAKAAELAKIKLEKAKTDSIARAKFKADSLVRVAENLKKGQYENPKAKLEAEKQKRIADKKQFLAYQQQKREEQAKALEEERIRTEAAARLKVEIDAKAAAEKEKRQAIAEAERIRLSDPAIKAAVVAKAQAEHEAKVKAEAERLRLAQEQEDQRVLAAKKAKEAADAKAKADYGAKVASEMTKIRQQYGLNETTDPEKQAAVINKIDVTKSPVTTTGGGTLNTSPNPKPKRPLTAQQKEAQQRAIDKAEYDAERKRKDAEHKQEQELAAKNEREAAERASLEVEAKALLEKEKREKSAKRNNEISTADEPVAKIPSKTYKGKNRISSIGIDMQDAFYSVQIASSSTPLSLEAEPFTMLNNVRADKTPEGIYKYIIGTYYNYGEALAEQKLMRNAGFKDAFAVAYNKGKRIPVADARDIINGAGKKYENPTVEDKTVSAPKQKAKVAEVLQEKSSLNSKSVLFRVQIAVSSVALAVNSPIFLNVKDEFVYKEVAPNGLNKYTVGETSDLEEALSLQRNMRARGYKDAFIVAYNNGTRIKVADAKALLHIK